MNVDEILKKPGKDWTRDEVNYVSELMAKKKISREALKKRREDLSPDKKTKSGLK